MDMPGGQQEQKHQYVFASGDPCDRFHPVRGDGEYQAARKSGAGWKLQPSEKEVEQDDASQIQKQVVCAIKRGTAGPQAAVYHVGNEVQRLVAFKANAQERIGDVFDTEGGYLRIVDDESVVVPIEKIAGKRRRNAYGGRETRRGGEEKVFSMRCAGRSARGISLHGRRIIPEFAHNGRAWVSLLKAKPEADTAAFRREIRVWRNRIEFFWKCNNLSIWF